MWTGRLARLLPEKVRDASRMIVFKHNYKMDQERRRTMNRFYKSEEFLLQLDQGEDEKGKTGKLNNQKAPENSLLNPLSKYWIFASCQSDYLHIFGNR